jgi:hypothetical protein
MPALKDTVVPIFSEKDNNMKAEGSGVLIQIADQFFILTAAHVLDVGNLYIPDINGLFMLNGFSDRTKAPEGDRALDRIDVGYVHLLPVSK